MPPATLARRLGTSRQAAQDLVGGLVRLGLVELAPTRPRGGRPVVLTATGRALAGDARTVLDQLERDIGEDRAGALRDLLVDFDGSAPTDPA